MSPRSAKPNYVSEKKNHFRLHHFSKMHSNLKLNNTKQKKIIICDLFLFSLCAPFQRFSITFRARSNDFNKQSRFSSAAKFLRSSPTPLHLNLGSLHGHPHWQRRRETCHVQGMELYGLIIIISFGVSVCYGPSNKCRGICYRWQDIIRKVDWANRAQKNTHNELFDGILCRYIYLVLC